MKFLLLFTLLITNAFAMNYEAIVEAHEKYCALNVKKACDAVYCADKAGKCIVEVGHQPQAEKKAMDTLMKKCGKDKACLIKETEAGKEIAIESLTADCKKEKIEACYELALIKAM